MKLYGSKRKSCQTCKYGCCGSKEAKLHRFAGAGAVRKAARHRARRKAREEATQEATE